MTILSIVRVSDTPLLTIPWGNKWNTRQIATNNCFWSTTKNNCDEFCACFTVGRLILLVNSYESDDTVNGDPNPGH